ncbi:MAG: NUDIX hydrolase [Candidatus Komeilibacteria bacterium]|nr:NUDIX hydrolase [Candidatus Komeilibacteria bacterium]
MKERPKIGVAVVINKNDKILLGLRKGSHGTGTWGFPGGHLEFNESIEDCAIRELREECSLTVANFRHLAFTNDIYPEGDRHYVTLFLLADYVAGEPKNLEPEKLEKWEWFSPDQLPSPLFFPIVNLLKQRINII